MSIKDSLENYSYRMLTIINWGKCHECNPVPEESAEDLEATKVTEVADTEGAGSAAV